MIDELNDTEKAWLLDTMLAMGVVDREMAEKLAGAAERLPRPAALPTVSAELAASQTMQASYMRALTSARRVGVSETEIAELRSLLAEEKSGGRDGRPEVTRLLLEACVRRMNAWAGEAAGEGGEGE